MKLISEGWTIKVVRLEGTTKRDVTHDIAFYPNHDGEWFVVVDPQGFLLGYVDSPEQLDELLARHGLRLADFREA